MSLALVLDANIIIRAILGKKVKDYLLHFNETVAFFTTDECISEVKEHLPIIFEKRGMSSELRKMLRFASMILIRST